MRRIIMLILLCCSSLAQAMPTDIFLLRHSEKLSGKDPQLSPQGQQRSLKVAKLLAPYQPTLLLSTDYQRTQQTIAPLAQQLKLKVTSYDPRKLTELADWIQRQTGVVVIVGHSNTTPQLTQLLSGLSVAPMAEHQYGTIYRITTTNQTSTLTTL